MSDLPTLELKTCRHCGAECDVKAQRCWLCHGDVAAAVEVVTAEVVPEPSFTPGDTIFAVASAVLALVIVLVGVGAALTEPGLAIMMAIVVAPALVATAVRIQHQKVRRGYVGWGERLATFLVSASLVFALLSLLGVALVIAMIVFCFVALATGNF